MSRLGEYICVDCGVKYLSEEQKKSEMVVTFHFSKCDECEEHKVVTSIRHYNYGVKQN